MIWFFLWMPAGWAAAYLMMVQFRDEYPAGPQGYCPSLLSLLGIVMLGCGGWLLLVLTVAAMLCDRHTVLSKSVRSMKWLSAPICDWRKRR